MKKALAIALAVLMVLSLAACGKKTNNNESKPNESKPGESTNADVTELTIDMSKYPAKLEEWTGQNLIDYFKEAGVFKDGDGFETWSQDHATYWAKTPVNECVGCWDDSTTTIMIAILSADNADTSEEQLNEWVANIKEKKALPGDYSSFVVDHLIGNIAFSYEATVLDDEIYNKMTDAYNYLVKSMGVTPEF